MGNEILPNVNLLLNICQQCQVPMKYFKKDRIGYVFKI
jgi:hypothetical protein